MRRREAVAEALRNLRSTPVRTALTVLLAVAAGYGSVAATAHDTAAISDRYHRQVRAGRFVLVVEAGDSEGFPAAHCDAFASVSGVEAAGATLRAPTALYAANRPTYPYQRPRITPGMLGVLYPALDPAIAGRSRPGRPGVLVGPVAARELGLVDGAVARQRRGPDLAVSVLPHSPRRPETDAKFVTVAAPDEAVRECDVAADPDSVEAVEQAALGWFATSGRAAVSPLIDRPLGLTPERELAARSSRWAWVGAAGVLAVLQLSAWFARRQDFALYRLLGARPVATIVMLGTETVAALIVPALAGASFAITRAQGQLADPVVSSLTTHDLASFVIALTTLPAVAGAALLLRRPFEDLKGA